MIPTLRRLWLFDRTNPDRERGAGLIEYSLLVALIAVVCLSALAFFGNGSGNSLNNSKDCIDAAQSGQPLPSTC